MVATSPLFPTFVRLVDYCLTKSEVNDPVAVANKHTRDKSPSAPNHPTRSTVVVEFTVYTHTRFMRFRQTTSNRQDEDTGTDYSLGPVLAVKRGGRSRMYRWIYSAATLSIRMLRVCLFSYILLCVCVSVCTQESSEKTVKLLGSRMKKKKMEKKTFLSYFFFFSLVPFFFLS